MSTTTTTLADAPRVDAQPAAMPLATWARFPEDDLILLPERRARSTFGRGPLVGGLLAALAYCLAGVFVVPRYGVMTDALARVADAFYVLFGRGPHPEAIGFVWTPLPSVLMLPLVALKGLWPPLAQEAIAANIVSAAFGGVAVYYLLRIVHRLAVPRGPRWAIAALFVLNPAVAFYATNGMSDLMMEATMLGAVDGLWGYLEEGSFPSLLVSGVWVAVGFLTRYEVAFWAAVVAGALALGLARHPLRRVSAQHQSTWIAGLLLFWLTPLVCAVATWVFANWMIMGDPLYFVRSSYGNASSIGSGAYAYGPLTAAHGSVGGTLAYILHQTLLFPPVAIGLLGLLAFGLRGRYERHTRALVLVAATLGVPLLQVLLLYRGISAGWLRFFLAFVPFGFVLVAYGVALLVRRWPRHVAWAWVACLLVLAGGNGATYAMIAPTSSLHAELRYEPLQGQYVDRDVVAYLNAHPALAVLTDSFSSFPIIIQARRPKQFIITSDLDFKSILDYPFGRANAFLVPRPTTVGTLDAVNRRYPRLWSKGAPWAHLIAEFPGSYHWRLYAIDATGYRRPRGSYWFDTCVTACSQQRPRGAAITRRGNVRRGDR